MKGQGNSAGKKMLKKQFKELWQLRFRRILDGEKESYIFYKGLLRKNEGLLEGTKYQKILEEIMRDEVKHIRIVRQLIQLICESKKETGCEEKKVEGGGRHVSHCIT